ncbi:LysR family transcriptional regulator [Sagittula stellata]|uniref:Probable LysR-family transcriptional regulator n=1 Tax=Sagittula stellata (strain ATCC 700073 / DSM 11524 / E-37) TaxID=388399 RepID=A3K4Q2_SAGS3|nr:LysR family transcriptional regulator [Sagittula stellata]EBA07951.1 probable LysR-family transcriptional regulator [Sagittula stellata E-37]
MQSLSTRHLRVILAIADAGSITAASQDLGVSQPALSASLRQAEEIVGLPLFDRTARRARPTAAGETLIPEARRILSDVDRATDRLRDLAAGRIGQLSIASLPSAVTEIVAPALRRFVSAYPGIRVAVRDALNAEVSRAIRSGEVDLGFGVAGEEERDLSADVVRTDSFIAVLPAGHRLCAQETVSWSDFAAETLVEGAAGSNTRASVRRHLGVEGAGSAIECSFVPTTIGLVRNGLGVSVLSELACRPFARDERITLRPLLPVVERPISILRRGDRPVSPAARLFLEFIEVA